MQPQKIKLATHIMQISAMMRIKVSEVFFSALLKIFGLMGQNE